MAILHDGKFLRVVSCSLSYTRDYLQDCDPLFVSLALQMSDEAVSVCFVQIFCSQDSCHVSNQPGHGQGCHPTKPGPIVHYPHSSFASDELHLIARMCFSFLPWLSRVLCDLVPPIWSSISQDKSSVGWIFLRIELLEYPKEPARERQNANRYGTSCFYPLSSVPCVPLQSPRILTLICSACPGRSGSVSQRTSHQCYLPTIEFHYCVSSQILQTFPLSPLHVPCKHGRTRSRSQPTSSLPEARRGVIRNTP